MSQKHPNKTERPHYKLTFRSSPEAELFLVSPDLSLADRGVGELTTSLPAGLYIIKATLLDSVEERIITLDRDRDEYLDISASTLFKFSHDEASKIENFNHELPVKDARELGLNQDGGRRTRVLIAVMETGQPREQSSAAQGFRIMRWRGVEHSVALAKLVQTLPLQNGRLSLVRLELSPGTYILQYSDKPRPGRLVIPAIPNYEVRAVLKTIPPKAEGVRGFHKPDLRVSLRVAPPLWQPLCNDVRAEKSEIIQNALAAGRRLIIDERGIRDALNEKFSEPLMGLAAAHLMVEALERAQATGSKAGPQPKVQFSPGLVSIVFKNLCKLFRAEPNRLPPDLVALGLRARPFAQKDLLGDQEYDIDEPPVFEASWQSVVKAGDQADRVRVARGLWSSVARNGAIGPYFSWQPDRVNLEETVKDLLASKLIIKVLQSELGEDKITLAKSLLTTAKDISLDDLPSSKSDLMNNLKLACRDLLLPLGKEVLESYVYKNNFLRTLLSDAGIPPSVILKKDTK